jgi:hypothetical protein
MTNDELGEKGEAHFKEICADAGLICNKADRDRAGWDFVIDFKFPDKTASTVTLEGRKAPLSCHVQLKTVLENTDAIEMRLSSAERLAKELKPSFVYVFKVDKDGGYSSAYLIHLRGEALAAILKRLRKESVSGEKPINKLTISMALSKYGTKIEPTGEALHKAISELCGDDMHAYANAKNEELENLGFSEHPYSMTLVMPGGWDEMVDMFLGDKPSGKVLSFDIKETRFGIERPIVRDGETAKLEFKPKANDECVIVVRSDEFPEPAVFRGEVFAPVIRSLPKEHMRMLFKTDFFKLVWSNEKRKLSSLEHIEPQTPTAWLGYFRFLLALALGSGSVQVSSVNHPNSAAFDLSEPYSEIDADVCRQYIKLCELTISILKRAGVLEEPKIDMKEMSNNADRIDELHSLLNPKDGPTEVSFTSEYQEPMPESVETEMLYVRYLHLGDATIAYYATMQASAVRLDDEMRWRSQNVNLLALREIKFFPQQYAKFVDEAKSKTGLQSVIAMVADDE